MANQFKNINSQGCLSQEVIFDYLSHKLSKKEERIVEMHMHNCELCSDAIEGLSQIKNPAHTKEIISELGKKINRSTRGTNDYIIRISVIAASLLLISLSIVFLIYNKKEDNMVALESPHKISKDIPKESSIRLPDATSSDASIANNESIQQLPQASKRNEAPKQTEYLKEEIAEDKENFSAISSSVQAPESELHEKELSPISPSNEIALSPAPAAKTESALNEPGIDSRSKKASRADGEHNENLQSATPHSDKHKLKGEDLLYEGELKFIDKDYEAAAVLLEKFLQSNQQHAKALYLAGICDINIKQHQKAIEKLKKIEMHSLYFDEAQYYLAKAYIGIGNKKEAKDILDLMINRNVNKAKALELEKSIE